MSRVSRRTFMKLVGAGATVMYGPAGGIASQARRIPGSVAQGGRAAPIDTAHETLTILKIKCTEFTKSFMPTCLSNGLIGIRPGPNPLAQAQTVVGGFVRSDPTWHTESLAPAPYPLGTDIKVNGVSLLETRGALRVHSQTLDMETGELLTEMTFSPAANLELGLNVLQFASRSVPGLLCQEILITPSSDVTLEVSTHIDRKGVPGSAYVERAPTFKGEPETQVCGFQNDRNKLGIAVVVLPSTRLVRKGLDVYLLEGKGGEASTFSTIAAMVSDIYHPDPAWEAVRLAKWGEMLGLGRLRTENRECWSDLWKSRVKVDGDAEAQKGLDAAFFYLHSSFHPSCRTGVAPYALSQYEYLGGRVFWDMDSWCLPPIYLTSPAAGKAMLEYRLRGLEAARKRAALFGYKGAQFPWESTLEGYEGCPSSVATGWAEQHVAPDAALAFWEYQLAAGDGEFLREGTWPVLRNVAEWIASRGRFTKRGFEIQHIMGVDESLPNIDNSSYMNLISKMVMQAAVACARKVGSIPPPHWERIAQSMVVPLDNDKQVVVPYDQAKPGPSYSVGMLQYLFTHGVPVSMNLFKKTYEFEERLRVTLPPTGHNPCSPKAPGFVCPPFAACAAFFGDRRKAAELFRNAWKPYWVEPYGLMKEYQFFPDGNYITGCGSLLQAVMFGFTGLRISDGDWRRYPAALPEGWKRMEVDRIWVRGKPKRLIAEHGKLALLLDESSGRMPAPREKTTLAP